MRLLLALAWLFALCGAAQAHEITFSHIEVRLEETRTLITAQLPIKALLHEQPALLPAGTTEQSLRSGALPAQAQVSLARLLTARLHVRSGQQTLPLTVQSVRQAGDDIALLAYAGPVEGALQVEANLFPKDELHKVFVTVLRAGDLAGQYVLDRQDPAFVLATPDRPLPKVVIAFVGEGIRHIFIGPDHILFVLALVLLGGPLWTQIKIISAFTVAHSVTLVLATLNIVALPSRLVESVIALSIVVVGLHDLWRLRGGPTAPPGRDPRVLFALAFGLVHGFGFASVLAELDLPTNALAWSLAAFNVGVEIGQVTIVLLAAPLLAALSHYASPKFSKGVLSAAACAVVVVGGVWFTQRAFGA